LRGTAFDINAMATRKDREVDVLIRNFMMMISPQQRRQSPQSPWLAACEQRLVAGALPGGFGSHLCKEREGFSSSPSARTMQAAGELQLLTIPAWIQFSRVQPTCNSRFSQARPFPIRLAW
jgi:hypothetical protein